MSKLPPSPELNEAVKEASNIIRNGGVILYPTDTIWGLGCDATNSEAVAKIYDIKQRSDAKSLIILIDNLARIGTYVHDIPDVAYDLIEVADKPLTIIYDNAKNLAPNVIADNGSIGIRVVQHEFCQRLIGRINKPIVSTSANISGMTSPLTFDQIDPKIINAVDFVVPQQLDTSTNKQPSSIIALGSGGLVKIIRP